MGNPKISRYLALAQTMDEREPVDGIAEHRKHCEADPGECPFEKQADRADEFQSDTTSKSDAAYADAVKKGDKETALRMIREAAAKAMPNTKVVDKDGLPLVVYHGGGTRSPNRVDYGEFYFYDDKRAARGYGKTMSAFVDVKDPVIIDAEGRRNDDVYGEVDYDNDNTYDNGTSIDKVVSDAMYNSDHDGVIVQNVVDTGTGDDIMGTVVVAFNYDTNNIKSADITYDDAGNLIPLSKRFDMKNIDIRN